MPEIKLKDPIIMRPENQKIQLKKLINSFNKNDLVFVEIGSYRGESAEVFLQSGKIKKMYCVDPWLNFYDDADIASNTDMNAVMADFDRRIMDKYPQVEKCRGTVDTFILGGHERPDVVYIDANHTYDACRNDISKVIKYLDPAIAIAGHDYFPTFGVFKAVNDILGKPDMQFGDLSWIVFRKNTEPYYGIINK